MLPQAQAALNAFFSSTTADRKCCWTGIIAALLISKWVAAELAGRSFGYSQAVRQTIVVTLPQVAATLTATLVAFDTFDPAGHRLIDERLLNAVLVLMLTTAILGV